MSKLVREGNDVLESGIEGAAAPRAGSRYIGWILGLFAGASWGTTALVTRYMAHTKEINPSAIVFWRFALATPMLFLVYKLTAGNGRRFEWRDFPKLFVLSALGTAIMADFGFYAARYTTNINITIIITGSAVFIAIIAWLLGADITRRQWAGIVVGLAGVALTAFAKPAEESQTALVHVLGVALALGSSITWALYTVFGRATVAKYGGFRTTVWAVALGALMQAPLALFSGLVSETANFTSAEWGLLVYLAVVPTAIAFSLWFVALRYLDVTTLGMTQYVGPVLSAYLGWLLLGEKIQWFHVVGGALVFAGLYFAAERRRRRGGL